MLARTSGLKRKTPLKAKTTLKARSPMKAKPARKDAPAKARPSKPRKATKSKTKAEREHLGKVARLGCCLCRRLGYGATPAEVHHLRDGYGTAERASHFETIPLCPEHHRGATGFHGLGCRAFEARYSVTERELLEATLQDIEAMERMLVGNITES